MNPTNTDHSSGYPFVNPADFDAELAAAAAEERAIEDLASELEHGASSPNAPAKTTLEKMERSRDGIFRCSLQECRKPFESKSDWERHMRTHSGVKPFFCGHCDRAMSDSSNLVKHLRRHAAILRVDPKSYSIEKTADGKMYSYVKV